MTDLTDFGLNQPDPPHMKKERAVKIPDNGHLKKVGWYGYVPERDCLGFMKTVNYKHHHIHKCDAWAISDSALKRLPDKGIELVFVDDFHTGHVWEYLLEDFTERGGSVPDWVLADKSDPQTMVCDDSPQHLWKNHHNSFVLPRDASVTASGDDFIKAGDM